MRNNSYLQFIVGLLRKICQIPLSESVWGTRKRLGKAIEWIPRAVVTPELTEKLALDYKEAFGEKFTQDQTSFI